MFALESLALNDETYYNSRRVRQACEFLRSKQKLDGGWGETYMVRRVIFPLEQLSPHSIFSVSRAALQASTPSTLCL